MTGFRRRMLLAAFVLSSSTGVSAHHSPSIYDTTETVTITGTVVAFEWVQPHTWTRIRATDASGHESVWSLEGMSPSYLGRRNWNRYSLRAGEIVTVTFFPRADGTAEGMLLSAELPDGTRKVMAIGPPREAP